MTGRQETNRELFGMISLDVYVPESYLLRPVGWYLDLSEFSENLTESHSQISESRRVTRRQLRLQ